jgi:hypothetical protein
MASSSPSAGVRCCLTLAAATNKTKSLKRQQHKPEDYYKFNSKLFNKYRGEMPKTLFFLQAKIRPIKHKKSHRIIGGFLSFLVRLAGIEPTTPWFVAKYSIQLSYSRTATKIIARVLPYPRGG